MRRSLRRIETLFSLLVLTLLLSQAGCGQMPPVRADIRTPLPSETLQPSIPPTQPATVTPAYLPTYTPAPTRTSERPLAPSPTPTISLPVVAGQPFPRPVTAIQPENASQLVALARFGEPAVLETHISGDGSRLVYVTAIGIDVYETSSRRLVAHLAIEAQHGAGQAVSVSAKGDRLLVVTGQDIRVVASSGDVIQVLPAPASFIYSGKSYTTPASLSPDGNLTVALSCSGSATECMLNVRSVADNRVLFSVAGQPDGNAPEFSPDGSLFAAQSLGSVWIYRTSDWKFQQRVWLGDVAAWAFSPDGKTLAIRRSNRVELWDLSSHHLFVTINGFAHSKTTPPSVAFSEHAQSLAVLDAQNTLSVWKLPKGRLVSQRNDPFSSLVLYQVMDSGELIALSLPARPAAITSASPLSFAFTDQDRTLMILNKMTTPGARGSQLCRLVLGEAAYCSTPGATMVPDARGTVYRMEAAQAGQVLSDLNANPVMVLPRMDPATRVVWISAADGVMAYRYPDPKRPSVEPFALQSIANGNILLSFDRQPERTAISTNASTLALVVEEQQGWRTSRNLIIINIRNGAPVYKVEGLGPVDSLAVSPSGRWAAWGEPEGSPGGLTLVDLQTGQPGELIEVREVNDGTARIEALQFSPDERLLAVGFSDGSLSLLNMAERKVINIWQAHRDSISQLAFSSDGAMLATYSQDGFIEVWGLRPW